MFLAILLSFIGVICAIAIVLLNCFFIYLFKSKKHHNTNGMTQFSYRFHLDVIIGITMSFYIGHTLTFYIFPDFFETSKLMVLWFGLLTANLQMSRIMFQLFITCDRVVAAFLPITYHIYHSRVPVNLLFCLSLCIGLSQNVAYFYVCENLIDVPINCLSLGCATTACFRNYWSTFQTVVISIVIFPALAFYIRLFVWSKPISSFAQANRLAVIDAVTTFFCQFVPPLYLTLFPDFELFQLSYSGPFLLFGKILGSTIESIVMFWLLTGKFTVHQPKIFSVRDASQRS